MPTLIYPPDGNRQRFSKPVGPTSRVDPVAVAKEVAVALEPHATTGNTVEDHLTDIKARLNHFTDSEVYKGEYSNSTTYAMGDEVSWTNNSRKHFYKRLVAGDDGSTGTPLTNPANWDEIGADIHNISVSDTPITNTQAAALWRDSNGKVQFNRRVATMLIAAQTEAEVATAIEAQLKRVVDKSLWKGTWAAGTYSVGDYALDNSNVYRCIAARSGSNTAAPNADSTGWVQVTGTELQGVQRIRDIIDLLGSKLDIPKAAIANRGRWPSRRVGDETLAYNDPPMQFKGNWSSSGGYYFGDVVVHSSRMYVLTATSTVTTQKQSSTGPGGDSDWTDISFGHSDDTSGWKGTWNSTTAYGVGDLVIHRGNYYLSKTDHAASGTAPDRSEENWDLIDNWMGVYDTDEYYPQGGVVSYDSHLWWASTIINSGDPDPGEADDEKWRQIDGATDADLERLRLDLEAQINSAVTRRGVTVTSLPEPPTTSSPAELYLRQKDSRSYTAPAAQNAGDAAYTYSIGDEQGVYIRTSGTPNLLHGVVGKATVQNRRYYGIWTREDHSGFSVAAGKFTHNPVGSGVLILGVQETAANSGNYRGFLMMKENLANLIGAGTKPSAFWVLPRNHAGTAQQVIHFSEQYRTWTLGKVSYQVYRTLNINERTALGNMYESGSSEQDRAATFELRLSASGPAVYLGNRDVGWMYEPPETNTDNLVFSSDVHTVEVYTQEEYAALEALTPRSLVLVYNPAG